MTLDEAKTDLNTLYKTLQRERTMRARIIQDPAQRAAGLAEIDAALAALLRLKDELKHWLTPLQQAPLFEVPNTREY